MMIIAGVKMLGDLGILSGQIAFDEF